MIICSAGNLQLFYASGFNGNNSCSAFDIIPPYYLFSLIRLFRALLTNKTMPAFQAKTFRRTPTASSPLGERIGAAYRSRLSRHPFMLFGLPFITVIVAASFALTPAAALRYEHYDRKVQQLSKEEAMDLGLRGPDGEEGIKRNPRRRVIGDEREEYYVCHHNILH